MRLQTTRRRRRPRLRVDAVRVRPAGTDRVARLSESSLFKPSRPLVQTESVRTAHQSPRARYLRRGLRLAVFVGVLAIVATHAIPRMTLGVGPLPIGAVSGGMLHAAESAPKPTPMRKVPDKVVFEDVIEPFFKTYCVDCHGELYAEAKINLEAYPTIVSIKKDRKKWNHILGILRIGAMPPSDHKPQPPMALRNRVVDWLDHALNYVDCGVVDDPGEVMLRRLNRVEYNNTIRDLVGVDFDPADTFPSDDVGNGFDNQGAVLTLPPLLMEKYLDAAAQIARKAIVTDISSLLRTRKPGDRLSSHGLVSERFSFRPGKYMLRAEVEADQAGDEPAKTALVLDGEEIQTFEVEGEDQANVFEVTVEIGEAGNKEFGASFLNDYYDKDAKDEGERDRNLQVNWLEIEGPEGGVPDLPDSHTRIITATPETAGSVRAAAEQIFTPLATRAFRRPAEPIEVKQLANLVEMAVERGESFEQAVAYGVQAVLVSPHFLFRIEDDFREIAGGKAVLGDYELASRLSYFLWSSMPDAELFALAGREELSKPEVLEHQVRRMLADEKSQGLVRHFFGQWLNLRNLNAIEPDPREFPWWNSQLQTAMRKETELFCAAIIREDRPIMDLLRADFTYVNPRLAELYGIEWKGKDPEKLYYAYDGNRHENDYRGNRRSGHYKHEGEFVRVSLPANRRGVLTQASILTLTSNPGFTSPVKRGKWILENLLGTPPPPPPPGIPSLEEAKQADPDATLREQLALHRSDPSCASCHKVMDPLGLAFEHYNVIGKWRDTDSERKIDASGQLEDGESFSGAVELIKILEERDEQIVRHFVEKLMTYALGRGLKPFDRCAVDEVMAAAKEEEFRISAVVLAIVRSDPFRMTRHLKDSQ